MNFFRKLAQPDVFLLGHRPSVGNKLVVYLSPVNLAILAAVAFSYFIFGKAGLLLATPDHGSTALWLPSGICLAAVLLRGNRVWPGIFVGAFLVGISSAGSILSSLGMALNSTLEALAGAYLVNRFAHGVNAFYRPKDLLRFVLLAGVLATALCAAIGVRLLYRGGFAGWTDFLLAWSVWWVGDMLGTIIATPFLVLLLGRRHHSLGVAEQFELAFLLNGLAVVCVLIFGPSTVAWVPRTGLIYLCAPFLVWSGLRFCPLEAAGATLIMSGFALWGSLHGYGPYGDSTSTPFLIGGYLAVTGATTLTIAAASAQQKRETEDVLAMYHILKKEKDGEINALQATVRTFQVELAKHGLHRKKRPTGGAKP
jgi:integral membrane sensor domain MASE1